MDDWIQHLNEFLIMIKKGKTVYKNIFDVYIRGFG